MGKPCPHLLFYSTGGVKDPTARGEFQPETFVLPHPGDLHNTKRRVPAQRCLAGKSGLASLIIARAAALPLPKGFTHTGSAGGWLRRCLFSCSTRFHRLPLPSKTQPAGPQQALGAAHPSLRHKGRNGAPGCPPCRVPPAQPAGRAGARRGALAQALLLPKREDSVTKPGTSREQGSGGDGAAWEWSRDQVGAAILLLPVLGWVRFCHCGAVTARSMPFHRHGRSPGTQAKGQGRIVGCIWGITLWWLLPL